MPNTKAIMSNKFKKAVIISKLSNVTHLDFGEVVESMLFYEDVKFYVKDNELEILIKSVPPNILITLIEDYGLSILWTNPHLLLARKAKGQYINFGVGFQNDTIDVHTKVAALYDHYYPNKKGLKQIINRVNDRINTYHTEDITQQVLDDLLDHEYINYGLNRLASNNENLKRLGFHFFRDSDNSCLLELKSPSNLQIFDSTGHAVQICKPFEAFLHAREQLVLASSEQCNISTLPLTAELMTYKTNSIVQKATDTSGLQLFQDEFIPNFHKISEKINSDINNLEPFIKILDKSRSLRKWLSEIEDDKNVLSDYYQKLTETTWVEKLPTKGIRFLIFSGAGIITDAIFPSGLGTIAGTLLGAGDAFILDKLLHRWTPNYKLDKGLRSIQSYSAKLK